MALGEGARALGHVGLDNRLGGDPVAQGILAVLNDGLAGLIAIVGVAGLTRSDGSVVDQVEQVLSIAGDNGDLLAVLAERIKLVLEGSLDLFAGDVGQLSLGDEGLGLGTDKLLLQHDDARRVGVLVLELGNLIGDLLLAVAAGLDRGLDVADALDGHAVLVVAVNEQILELADLVNQNA